MQNWFTRSRARWNARREVDRLAALPDYLLRDMGLTLEGRSALVRQISRKRNR